ncbi:Tn3 family transposase [Rickettsia endosymbiont of Oedothorax gibbosus]|uniref:Tn3 family transposase n=1 Tax=Rickettsia endosymbiont of Oedothorax gibbosus TaxID=931099 RepID=UPI002023D27D|nr:Tn3 family transposase [Rickettsia endosymbiont of Oedothorax gibbosus]
MQYNLSLEDLNLCKKKKGQSNQLTFAIMLVYFKKYIQFPSNKANTVSMQLLLQVAKHLDIDPTQIITFDWDTRTGERYRQDIRQYLGYRVANAKDITLIMNYLVDDLIPRHFSDSVLLEQIRTYFIKDRIEIVNTKQLENYISLAKQKFEQQFFRKIFDNLSQGNLLLIDRILSKNSDEDNNIIELSELKKDISGAKIKNIQCAINKINLLGQIKLSDCIIESVDRKLLLKYYERVMVFAPSNILDFAPTIKYATMAIFCSVRLELLLDALIDTMIKLIKKMRAGAEKHVDRHILQEVKRVDGKFGILEKLAILNAKNPKSIIEDKVYPVVPQEKLEEVIEDLQHRGSKWYQAQVREKMHTTYAYGNRGSLLAIIRILQISEDHIDYQPILKAIRFINQYWNESDLAYYINIPPINRAIPQNWYSMIFKIEKGQLRINKYNYELAILEQIKELLGFKAIWVNKSYRYRDPNKDLPKDFIEKRESYYELLGLPLKFEEFVEKLKTSLTNSLDALNANIPNNQFVKIQQSKVGNNIKLTPLDSQDEPDNIIKLQQEINNKWSSIHLIDILKECDLRINFTKELETVGKSSNINSSDLQRRLLLCIFGIGSNTGLKRISIANDNVNYSDLRYVKKRHINATNIRNAIRTMVNNVLKTRNPDVWGEATTTVACDSTHLFAWDQNLMSEWHFRYGKKGVMIYWHVDKKSLCIYSQLKDCTSSEVGSMIKGIIDHDTDMDMNRVFVDTHGQSVIGFAVSYLLDFSLCPRLKAINKQKLYYVDSRDRNKYKNISEILKGSINWELLEDNYDETVKHMVALKLGIVTPSVLIKRFSNNNYAHPVYKALVELGKANKTIFLCKYLSSEELRIEVNEGLNIVERLNNVMDFIFYGKLGHIATNNIEDQELSVLCLHLLQVCMVYINTLIIQQILSQPHWQNRFMPEDYRALTPLFSGHINPYGLFPLDFNKRLLIGITI